MIVHHTAILAARASSSPSDEDLSPERSGRDEVVARPCPTAQDEGPGAWLCGDYDADRPLFRPLFSGVVDKTTIRETDAEVLYNFCALRSDREVRGL